MTSEEKLRDLCRALLVAQITFTRTAAGARTKIGSDTLGDGQWERHGCRLRPQSGRFLIRYVPYRTEDTPVQS